MLKNMLEVRDSLKNRIHDALAGSDRELVNRLLLSYNEINWHIKNLEETLYHIEDIKQEMTA